MTNSGLVLGTRGSDLALWQARHVAGLLGGEAAGVRIEIVRTQGDRAFDAELSAQGGSGLFTRDIEEALVQGRLDAAVHSLKDLPTQLPDGLVVAAIPPRAEPGDVLLVRPDALDESDARLPLKRGARVGTGSPRRLALLRELRPDAITGAFRGNVPTRVAKCAQGEVDAVLLARAGLDRLALDVSPLVAFDLDPAHWIPAPAQGALAIEARAGDERTLARLAALDHAPSAGSVAIERELLRLMEAGCHAALGAWSRSTPEGQRLDAGCLGDDGRWRRISLIGSSESLAGEAAEWLTSDGATLGVREGLFRRREA